MVFFKANCYALMRYDLKTMIKYILSTKNSHILKEKINKSALYMKINGQMEYLFILCQIVYTNYVFHSDFSFKHILTTSSSWFYNKFKIHNITIHLKRVLGVHVYNNK